MSPNPGCDHGACVPSARHFTIIASLHPGVNWYPVRAMLVVVFD